MSIMHKLSGWLSGMFVSEEEHFLSHSVDLADFERRQRLLSRSKSPKLYEHVWY